MTFPAARQQTLSAPVAGDHDLYVRAPEVVCTDADAAAELLAEPDRRLYVVAVGADSALAVGGRPLLAHEAAAGDLPMLGVVDPVRTETLGSAAFRRAHGVRLSYVVGEMARGIASADMVTAAARAGILACFGAGGLGPDRVRETVAELAQRLDGLPWGVNLLHNPAEPDLEEATAELLLQHRVPVISASAYMALTSALVRCAATGLYRDVEGRIQRTTKIMAKISRPEVARLFLSPAPEKILQRLVADGRLRPEEAELARQVPVATDITVEGDSGGHTDGRPLVAIFPRLIALRDELGRRYGYGSIVRLGAAGGLGTPESVAAAFAMGADYVLTGSINQLSIEADLSTEAKKLLAAADVADFTTAPAADMFEIGARVQVLKKGTRFWTRAQWLYDRYTAHAGLEDLGPADLRKLESEIFGTTVDDVWEQTRRFWSDRDPKQLTRAESDRKHRMALCFRWYLGMSTHWATTGETERRGDYQLWCGPAMGAFNRWAGSDIGAPSVVEIAENLMRGAAVLARHDAAARLGIVDGFPRVRYRAG
ncbi:PfaD family polyunsaturated fatty acid/polyketide biosynthesis protein [Nocardia paucivorans]|uniref:PfaD family polyunsaturated fatty acid/polyketide biosynthesis protein n=1 Tax=Nocardia paucivorans TaxID=114259 RepID=UPI0002F36FA8|nr:PfaD family polyunsaturated fatty acid/polyketide biosynthesis protein [Nocardia paucivorans]